MRFIILMGLLIALPLTSVAADTTKANAPKPSAEAPPPPAMPKGETRPRNAEGDTGLEPEVTIVTRGDVKYEEYRIRGRHYMTKVTPKQGRPYYLIDKEGSGQFRRSDVESDISAPNWVIMSW
jgi:hypothetical protein